MMQDFLTACDSFSRLSPQLRHRCMVEIVAPFTSALAEKGYVVKVSRNAADIKTFNAQFPGQDHIDDTTCYDIDFNPGLNATNYLGFYLEFAGKLVGKASYKLVDLFDPSDLRPLTFRETVESLRLYYEDPLDAPRRESARVECEVGDDIKRGTDCHAGDLWILNEHRGRGVFKAFGRLSRVLAITAFPRPWHWMTLLACDDNRDVMLDYFGCAGHYRGVYHSTAKHPNRHLWLGMATYRDAMKIALQPADRPFTFEPTP